MKFNKRVERDPYRRQSTLRISLHCPVGVWRGPTALLTKEKWARSVIVSDEFAREAPLDFPSLAEEALWSDVREKYAVGILRHWVWDEIDGWLILHPIDYSHPRRKYPQSSPRRMAA